jgi:c-di-AMP phosphodiesterase-like protein
MITKNLELKHEFSEKEINEIAHDMTDCIVKKNEIEEEKRSVTRQLNGQIKFWDKQIQDRSILIQDGWEYRQTSCQVEYNKPVIGQKTITRLDTYEKWTEPMSVDEYDLFNTNNIDTGALQMTVTRIIDEEE